MKRALAFARRDFPVRIVLPWLTLALLSPFWLIHLQTVLVSLTRAIIGIFTVHGPAARALLGSDLILFWPISRLIAAGHASAIYDPVLLAHHQFTDFGNKIPTYMQNPYPPPGLLLPLILVPFSYMIGYLVWTAVLTLAGILVLRRSSVPWPIIGIGLISVASFFNALVGQLGWFTGALFIAGLLAVERSPNSGGAWLGAIVIKPQAGLLGPIVLLARKQYRAIGIGAGVVGVLCVAATLVCGWAIWPAYLTGGLAASHHILVAPFPNQYEVEGASVFWMARSFGASVGIAGIAQVVSAACAVFWCWHAWLQPQSDRLALIALTVSLTLLVTPYGYVTDMCGFSIMVGWLAWERRRLEVADVLMWMWPALCPIVAIALHMELTPLVLLLGATRAWKRLAGIGTGAPACYPAAI